MTNLVIDLSNMFFRSLFIVGGYGPKSFSFNSQSEVDQLMRKVAMDISFIIRKTNPSRVIFTMDSTSWRKKINIEENEGYKANREKSTRLNWDHILSTLAEFGDILKESGFIVSKIETAEADDLISLWRDELLYNKNQHVIIVSADEDVRQLVCYNQYENNKKAFSVVFNPFMYGASKNRKLYVPQYFNAWIQEEDEIDIFSTCIDVDKEDFIRLRDTEKVLFEEVNGNEIALRKLFCGDDGDNIPAFYTWINDKGREIRITNSIFTKIKLSLNLNDVSDLNTNEKLNELNSLLAKLSGTKVNFDVPSRFQRQVKLVHLHRDNFPISIVEEFDKTKDDYLAQSNIHPQNWNVGTLLEGTRYVKSNGKISSGSEASIFSEIDKINKSLF
jgi:5'-3' exonuclease